MIGKITFVGNLKEIASKNPQYTEPLKVRTIEVKWYEPRMTNVGLKAGIQTVCFELRKELATQCSLMLGDIICFDYDIYSSRFADRDGVDTCASRLVISRYVVVNGFDELS